jgi:glycosyltransferase involved in cell wall biosynthesis
LSSAEVLIVASHRVSDSIGGVEKFVTSLSSWLDMKCFNVTVVSRTLSIFPVKTTFGPVFGSSQQENRLVKTVELPFQLYYIGLSFFSLCALIVLLRHVKVSRIQGNQIIVLHSQDINFAALATVVASKLSGIPSVIHQHGPYIDLLRTKNMKVIEQSINRIVCKLSDRIVATDKYTREYLLKIISNNDKTCILPAGIEIDQFSSKNHPPRNKSNYFEIGYIGRLSPEKNLATLIRAFADFSRSINSPSRLVLVGDGESRVMLKQLVEKLNIGRDVIFTGFRTNVKPFLSSFDVFILPSKVEGTPISLLEAMASGKAIIASDLPSIREIITNGKDGLLFSPDKVGELVAAMLRFHGSSELRKKFGTNAEKTANSYDINKVFEKLICLYRNSAIDPNWSKE